jgi:hydroxymethylglutaryl-CoA reductase (NADPH)
MPSEPNERPLPRIPRDRPDDHHAEILARRRALCAGVSGCALVHVGGQAVPPEEARGNIENMLGFAQVPLGIAGPLRVDTSAGVRDVYVPMATTEGAMVASYSRGMRLLGEGGGARARVLREGLSQHPVLCYADVAGAQRAARRAEACREHYAALTAEGTRHGALVEVRPEVLGRRLVLRLVFTTGDAIGVNMAAAAAERISADLARETGARARYVHGQDVEKRANARALVEGRGRSVVAEAVVPREALA